MPVPPADASRARAVRFVAPYRVDVADVDVSDPEPGEVLVRSEFSGISAGSELLAYRGELDAAASRDETLAALGGTFEYPFGYGYSAVGTVEASRAALGEGDRVFAFHPHQSRFVVPVDDAVRIGDCDPREATLFPLVETALQVALDTGIRYGEVAVVLGLGPVGLLCGLLLRRSGAIVVGGDPQPARRELARGHGLEAVEPAALRDTVGSAGADVVVEATGNPDVLGESLPLLRAEGVAVVVSWFGTKPVTLPLGGDFHRRRLEIRSSQVSSVGGRAARWDRRRRLETACRLLSDLPLAELASHTFPLERAPEAYAALDRGDDGVVHVALSYS